MIDVSEKQEMMSLVKDKINDVILLAKLRSVNGKFSFSNNHYELKLEERKGFFKSRISFDVVVDKLVISAVFRYSDFYKDINKVATKHEKTFHGVQSISNDYCEYGFECNCVEDLLETLNELKLII